MAEPTASTASATSFSPMTAMGNLSVGHSETASVLIYTQGDRYVCCQLLHTTASAIIPPPPRPCFRTHPHARWFHRHRGSSLLPSCCQKHGEEKRQRG